MTQFTQEEMEAAKTRINIARATGLLMGAKYALQCFDDDDDDEVAKDRLIKLIDEVLELLK